MSTKKTFLTFQITISVQNAFKKMVMIGAVVTVIGSVNNVTMNVVLLLLGGFHLLFWHSLLSRLVDWKLYIRLLPEVGMQKFSKQSLKKPLYSFIYFSEHYFTSFQVIYWIVFRGIKIWHFCKILGHFQFVKEKKDCSC